MRLRLPRTTFGLVALVCTALCLMTLLLGIAVYATSHEALERQLDHRIEANAHGLAEIAHVGGIAALAAAIERRETSHRASELSYLLVDARGRRLAGEFGAAAPPPGWLQAGGYRSLVAADGVAQALTVRLPGGERLVVAADRVAIDEIDGAILRLFLAAFGIMLVVGVAGAWGLGTVIRRRLDDINGTAQAIIDGDLAQRMARDGSGSEFDRLAETLNRMIDRNSELLDNLRQVSNDIAHDLRTPLTRQTQVLEDALAAGRDLHDYRQAIATAAESGREILGLFAALLRISEIETLAVRAGFVPVDLADIVERVVDAFRPDAEAAGHPFDVRAAGPCLVQGDRHLLSQLLVNLVENVIRHTPHGGAIAIALARAGDTVVLRVADQGPGIAAADREHVLRRFARLGRSRTTEGHGLGLSLVAAIARAHAAPLALGGDERGLVVTVSFAALDAG